MSVHLRVAFGSACGFGKKNAQKKIKELKK